MGGRKKGAPKLTLLSGLPEDVIHSGARVTLFGRGHAMIEGQSGVVELGVSRIRLRTKGGVLTVLGEALMLKEISMDAAMIAGERIDTITYAKISDSCV